MVSGSDGSELAAVRCNDRLGVEAARAPRQAFQSRRSGGHTELAKSSHCLWRDKGSARTALMTVPDRPRLVHGAKILPLQRRPLPLPASAASGCCTIAVLLRLLPAQTLLLAAGLLLQGAGRRIQGLQNVVCTNTGEHTGLPAASVLSARAPSIHPFPSCFPVICTLVEATRERAGATGPDRLAGTIAVVGSFHLWRRAAAVCCWCLCALRVTGPTQSVLLALGLSHYIYIVAPSRRTLPSPR